MKDYKNFYSKNNQKRPRATRKSLINRDANGRVHIAITSTIFSDISSHLLATNSMYAELLDDISPCLTPINTKEKIIVDVFETKQSDDIARESAVIGFRHYVDSCLYGKKKEFIFRLCIFTSFLFIGVLAMFLLYGLDTFDVIQEWAFRSIEVIATLFIWQWGGFLAFELPREVRHIRRYKQIILSDFNFKHWE